MTSQLLRIHAVYYQQMERASCMGRDLRKPDFCICENKDTDQLCGNREGDQRLFFRYTDSIIPLLPKSKISSPLPSSVIVQPGLCWTWSESPKTGFLMSRPICRSTIAKVGQKFYTTCNCLSRHVCLKSEPRRQKTTLRSFRPGPTQIRLRRLRKWLEA